MEHRNNVVQKRKVIIRYERAKSPTCKHRRRRVFPPPPDPEPLLVDVHSFTELVQSLTGREWSGQNAVEEQPEEQNFPAEEDISEKEKRSQKRQKREMEGNSNQAQQHSNFLPAPREFMAEMLTMTESADDFCEIVVENRTTASPLDDFLRDLPSPFRDSNFLLEDDLPGDSLQALSPQTRTLMDLANLEGIHFPTGISGVEENVLVEDYLFPATPPVEYRTASENLNFGNDGTGGNAGTGGGGVANEGAGGRDGNSIRPLSSWEHCLHEAIHGENIFQDDIG